MFQEHQQPRNIRSCDGCDPGMAADSRKQSKHHLLTKTTRLDRNFQQATNIFFIQLHYHHLGLVALLTQNLDEFGRAGKYLQHVTKKNFVERTPPVTKHVLLLR